MKYKIVAQTDDCNVSLWERLKSVSEQELVQFMIANANCNPEIVEVDDLPFVDEVVVNTERHLVIYNELPMCNQLLVYEKIKETSIDAYIYEDGKKILAEESKERVFCGYYASCFCDNVGDLFAVLSGPALVPAFDKYGKRINVGKDKAGMSSRDGKEWYNE